MLTDEIVANESKVDIIRMDIEGFEFEVIKGMIGSLSRFKPRLVIELHPFAEKKLMMSFLNMLESLGYEVEWFVSRFLIDGMLTTPATLVRATIDLIRELDSNSNKHILTPNKMSIAKFAEKFCSEYHIYHVIFARNDRNNTMGNTTCCSSKLHST